MFCPVLLNCAQITSQARTLGQPGLISFPLWTVLRSFENENNPIKLRSLVIELAFSQCIILELYQEFPSIFVSTP